MATNNLQTGEVLLRDVRHSRYPVETLASPGQAREHRPVQEEITSLLRISA